jgi:2-methylisocitrate lyase-like PEP mutase family enzyme
MASSLRQLLLRDGILVAPGAYDGFTAKLVQKCKFEAVYLTGAGVSYSTLGQPDVGLITLSEMCSRIEMLSEATQVDT